MKKILLILILMLLTVPAWCEEDDSTPYMPFPEQPPQLEQPKTQPAKKAPKKTTKKAQPKKKAPAKKAVKKAPAPRPSSLQQGIALMQQDRYEAAKPYLLKAIQENRNDPNAWYWYGVYHEKTGGFYQAQYFYSKAVMIDPAFEPLSRVVYYPEDKEKTPLWDPKRPARVYPVETSGRGIAAVPPNAKDRKRFPSAPSDPELPKVPVYVPPEPGASPLDGDSWSPAVYVPPAPEEVRTEGEHSPVYIPPEAQSITADENIINTPHREVVEIPLYQQNESLLYENEYEDMTDRDPVIRADKPLYNPPAPGQKIAQAKNQNQKKISQPSAEKQETKKQQPKAPRKIVKQSDKKNKTKAKPQPPQRQTAERTERPERNVQQRRNTNRPASRDVRPQVPVQPEQPRQPERPVQPVQPRVPEVPERREIRIEDSQPETINENHYLPPVGQFAPDPGTIPETYIPPVGQGNQN